MTVPEAYKYLETKYDLHFTSYATFFQRLKHYNLFATPGNIRGAKREVDQKKLDAYAEHLIKAKSCALANIAREQNITYLQLQLLCMKHNITIYKEFGALMVNSEEVENVRQLSQESRRAAE